jgi:hypothetical protein
MQINGADGLKYWLSIDTDHAFVNVTEVSDQDLELIEKFGESWIQFLWAANRPTKTVATRSSVPDFDAVKDACRLRLYQGYR